jgi:hypothetical protein
LFWILIYARYVVKSVCSSVGVTVNRSRRRCHSHREHAPAIRIVLNRVAPAIESTLWLACCLKQLLVPTHEYITSITSPLLAPDIQAHLCIFNQQHAILPSDPSSTTMRHSTENIRHFQWDAQQVQTYVSQAMAALTQDARTSRAFDTFDERKEAVRDVLKFTRCPLFGTWFATYSLLNDNTNKWRDWFPALVALCPEGLLTRVTLEHERV